MLNSIAIDKLMFMVAILSGFPLLFMFLASKLDDKINEMKRGMNNE